MKKEKIKEIIDNLLAEIEEEDIGMSLFSTCYQSETELLFFREEDRSRVRKILEKLSADCRRHKELLENIIAVLGEKVCEK